ncbi:DUF998 domain-containing protein [Clavibacter phaseoli]|uniref:DUF998 domain-containing protein n=1 Tax=Clavibacter phaseoli TaxID=1734031 RepID=UPI000E65F1DE|nr:DUF998 domain-containing protein [Clavibacter phaseoli]RIJ57188.1 DUF998 domain-containing protein [Clavibacter phaseoli]UKF32078.1 DUF998 domain-containing protein [Clavibacter phaseoli]UKF38000.1 DUF998 domain-containing protein [Clavibacter phaseoli]
MVPRHPVIPTAAGVAWIAAAVVYVGTEAIAASAFPGYSYSADYISDLGVPDVALYQGRAIDSPLHAVMNAGFILQGVLYLAAAVIATRALRAGPRRVFLALAAVHAVGITVVGIIHGSASSAASGIGWMHVVGAGMAIIAGNAASITAGLGSGRVGAARPFRVASVALGVVGLVALALLQSLGGSTIDGVWERGSVYTVTAWELMAGVAVLVSARRRAHPRD